MFNRTRIQTFVLFLFSFLMLCSSVALAQSEERLGANPGGSCDMQLFAKGNGVPGLDVGLKKKPGGQLYGNAKTDTGGKFHLGALEPGTYSIVLRIPESAITTFDSAIANARACGSTATETDPLNTVVRIEGARSVSVVVGVEMPRNRSFNDGVPTLTKVYEVQFEVTGRQAVSGEVGIVIKEAGVK